MSKMRKLHNGNLDQAAGGGSFMDSLKKAGKKGMDLAKQAANSEMGQSLIKQGQEMGGQLAGAAIGSAIGKVNAKVEQATDKIGNW